MEPQKYLVTRVVSFLGDEEPKLDAGGGQSRDDKGIGQWERKEQVQACLTPLGPDGEPDEDGDELCLHFDCAEAAGRFKLGSVVTLGVGDKDDSRPTPGPTPEPNPEV